MAISRCAPASVPSSVVSRPLTNLIVRPTSSKRSSDAPTVGMASVTKSNSLATFRRKRRADRDGIDMDSIDDQTRRQPVLCQRRADDPRFARALSGAALALKR